METNKQQVIEAVEKLHLTITKQNIIDVLTANGIDNAAKIVADTFAAEGIETENNKPLTAEQLVVVDALNNNDEWRNDENDTEISWQCGQILIEEWPQLEKAISEAEGY